MLALDLGIKTGWAEYKNDCIYSGVKDFKMTRYSGGGMRYLLFRHWLIANFRDFDLIYFEEVKRHKGIMDAHAFGAFYGTLSAFCEESEIAYKGIGVGVIKKFISGRGNASKDIVKMSVENLGFFPTDDNEADALALLLYGKYELQAGQMIDR